MSDAAQKTPHPVREDLYFAALEAFIRTSAGYLDVAQRLPEKGVPRQWYEPVTPVGALR
jgi:hypothetical protein